MKRSLAVLLALLCLISLSSVTVTYADSANPIKVACVGDSITEGFGRENISSYPTVLGKLLGDGYEVKNFGEGGSTLLEKGDKPYTRLDVYQESLDYKPDIVVIMLGTNDGKTFNWEVGKKETFKEELIALVESYRQLQSRPSVYLMTSPTVFNEGNFSIVPELVEEVVAIQREAALEIGCPVIDIHSFTEDMGSNFPDDIHPDTEGYARMAEYVCEGIKDNATLPNAPINLEVRNNNKRAIVLWKTGGNGGARFVQYNVFLDGVFHSSTNTTMVALKGLTNGQSYEVKITAVNEKGESEYSETIICTPTALTPVITGVEDGKQYDLADGYPKATWSTEATATLNGEEYLKDTEITSVGEYKLVVTNDNVVVEVSFSVVDSRAIPGDVDRDNNITVADALAILRVAAKLAVPEDSLFVVMDMDKDIEITVADALAVLRIAAKLN